MGCIRVDKMVDYMEEPLRKTLRDESPYVRKTAAICVAKLFDLNPTLCLENGFLETLQETGWNIVEAARRLDLARSHVYNLIRAFGLERKSR